MRLTRLLQAGCCFWLPPTPAQESAQEEDGSAPSRGSPACECVDPWAGAAPQGLAGPCRNATLGTQHRGGIMNDVRLCLPQNYGASYCRPWDEDVVNECVGADGTALDSGPPDWCGSSWCYVNASTCQRPHESTDMLWEEGAPAGLTFSYETCGNMDTYTNRKHYRSLRGKHLRVSYPGDSSLGYDMYTANASCPHTEDVTCTGTKDGSVVRFMRDLAREAQFTWQEKPVSRTSRERFSSTYTACVHE